MDFREKLRATHAMHGHQEWFGGRQFGHHGEGAHARGDDRPHFERRGRPGGPRGGRGGWPGGSPFGGFGGFGGRWFGHGPHIGRGDVRTAALSLLAEQPLHGYQIIQLITERSGGVWRPSPGSVYPALQLLEDEGLVRVEQVDARRVFHLTDAGRAYVAERKDELSRVWGTVSGTMDDDVVALHDLFGQVGVAVKQLVHAGSSEQVAEARRLLASTRRQLYRLLAEDDAPAQGQEPDAHQMR